MPASPHAQAYAELKGLLAQQGFFDRQPCYYAWKILQMLSGLGLAFPSMGRNQLKAAQATVQAFCQARAIPSHETSVWQAYRAIYAISTTSARHCGTPIGPSRRIPESFAEPLRRQVAWRIGMSGAGERMRQP
ncbi:MAG TPA: hypothetical protein VLK82_22120 [Candidatus Tectomicrobia bacterium]|nr:hypothetical protein [Candidatus Tectomicrobia bacterium]